MGGQESGRLGDVLRVTEVPEGPTDGPLGYPGEGLVVLMEMSEDLLPQVLSPGGRSRLARGIWNCTINFSCGWRCVVIMGLIGGTLFRY